MRYLWGLCGVTLATLSLAQPVYAALSVLPESVTIAGDRGRQASMTFTLNSEKAIPTLKTAVSDLRRADGVALIPASKITVEPQTAAIPSDGPTQIQVTVNFAEAKASGEFVGSLYLYFPQGQETVQQVVPMTVRVKDQPLWPWVLMIAGVLLGTGLSIYRAEGRSRDEVIVQVGRLRTEMRSDAELDPNFRAGIEAELVDVESALQDKAWETAKTQLLEAKTLWIRWRKGREDWITQLQYGKTLLTEEIPQLGGSVYQQEVQSNLEKVFGKLRTGQYDNPNSLQVDLVEIRRQVLQYKEAEAAIQKLKEKRRALPSEKQNVWLKDFQELETRLQQLHPDPDSFTTWKGDLDRVTTAFQTELDKVNTQPEPQATAGILERSSIAESIAVAMASVPIPNATFNDSTVIKAAWNLKWFNWLSRTVAIAILAWMGMTNLYADKPMFGANPMSDYLTLVAWGFGSELTRESVVRAAQDLGVPLTK